MGSYYFDLVALEILDYSTKISFNFGITFISKEILLGALFTNPASPIFRDLVKRGLTPEEISARISDYLSVSLERVFIETPTVFTLNMSNPTVNITEEEHIENEDSAESSTTYSINVENSLLELFDHANLIAEKLYNTTAISLPILIHAVTEKYTEDYEEVTDVVLNNSTPKGYQQRQVPEKVQSEYDYIYLPRELASFLTVLNNNFSPEEETCRICGREEESKKLLRILLKKTKRNAILLGEPGVGKSALIERLAWMIVTGNCPESFKDSVIISLDVNAIIAGTRYRGTAEKRFMNLIDFLETNPNYILFIDEIHLLLGAGSCREGELDLANALKPILARGSTQVIGATTTGEYEQYFSRDKALKRRFEPVMIKEPRSHEVYPMIKNQIKALEDYHNTTISKDLIDFVMLNAACFNYETRNPDRTLDLLDKSMVSAELNNHRRVTKRDILENFSFNKKQFNKMSLKRQKATAFHEAGHYIVRHFSPELSNKKTLAISIMPATDYLGVNVIEVDPDETVSDSRDYFIQEIAVLLAGRIAEKMYTSDLSAGASSDLKKATLLATKMVTEYAFEIDLTGDRVFPSDKESQFLIDTELKSEINSCINQILDEANEYATELLSQKREYLEVLVDALMAKQILSEADINKLFAEKAK